MLFRSVDRGYVHSPSIQVSRLLEDFRRPAGHNSPSGHPNTASNVSVIHTSIPEHVRATDLRAAFIKWTSAGDAVYFEDHWAAPGAGIDLSPYQVLDIRFDRQKNDVLNVSPSTNFSIALVDADGTLSSPVDVANYVDLVGPVGGFNAIGAYLHSMLLSARIPLADFAPVNLLSVRGVRLTFNRTETGAIYVSDIRADGADSAPPSENQPPIANAGPDQTIADSDGNGRESIVLDGSGSSDPEGTIIGYEWKEGPTVIGSGASPVVDLSIGTHVITLTVTDDDGAVGSDIMHVTVTGTEAIVPNAPSDLTATVVSSTQITLTWTDNSSNETGFHIEKKIGALGSFARIATVGANVVTYHSIRLVGGTEYSFRIQATDGIASFAYSNTVTATTAP